MAVNTVKGVLNDAYVSAVDLMHTREIWDQLYDPIDERGIFDFFAETGREMVSDQTDFHHFENNYVYQNITILSSTGTPGVGNDVTITLSVADHDGGKSFPKVTDIVMFTDQLSGYIIAKDESVPTAHTITVRPIDTVTDDIVTSTVDAEVLTFISNAHEEGSDDPDGLITKPIKFDGLVQIFRNKYGVTGSEATNRVEFKWKGKDHYYYKGEDDTAFKHRADCAFGMLFAPKSNGLTNAAGNVVRVTQGLAPQIREKGNIFTGGINGLPDIDTIIKTLDKQRGSKENLWLAGIEQDIDIDNVLIDKMVNGGITYNSFGKGDGKKKALDLGFNSFIKGSWSFHKRNMSELNHAKVTGAAGQTWPATGFILPTDKGRDAKSLKSIDSIRLRYKGQGAQQRKSRTWLTGGLAPVPTDARDILEFQYLSEKGLQCFGLKRFMIVEP